MAHTNPDISILELGTTTGLAAPSIIASTAKEQNGISQTFEYVFSCPNEDALKKAEEQLITCKNRVHIKLLDPEKDLSGQGFQSGTFDIVIISDPLGAAQDADRTLAISRKLLKTGGKLCLVNVTHPGMALSLVLRSLPSWSR